MTVEVPRAAFSGLLLRLKSDEPFAVFAERLEDVHHEGIPNVPGWHLFIWASAFDAGNDARGFREADGKYLYPLLLREVEERFLLASTHSDIVQQFITLNRLARQVERPKIDVAGLVNESVFPATGETEQSPSTPRYKMGGLHAGVDGFGRSVRSISLFGDDLGNAGMVREILKYLNPFRVSLREIRSEQEVLSISTQGEISFYYRGAASLEGVDKALSYVRRGNFIHWRLKK